MAPYWPLPFPTLTLTFGRNHERSPLEDDVRRPKSTLAGRRRVPWSSCGKVGFLMPATMTLTRTHGGPQNTPGLPQGESKDDHEEITLPLWKEEDCHEGRASSSVVLEHGSCRRLTLSTTPPGAKDYQRPGPFATHGSLAVTWQMEAKCQIFFL